MNIKRVFSSDEQIQHFQLEGLFAQDYILAVNTKLGSVTLMYIEEKYPMIHAQTHITTTDLLVLLPILSAYPQMCHFDMLYASFLLRQTDDLSIKRAHEQLVFAKREGLWNERIRSIRGAISRVRLKIHEIDMDIKSVEESGYILIPLSQNILYSLR